jgi:hypothetical protein
VPVVSSSMSDFSRLSGLGWEASSCSLAESLSVRASTAGPKTVARNFALLRFWTLARTLFAMLFIRRKGG